jgi:hypothetical protein
MERFLPTHWGHALRLKEWRGVIAVGDALGRVSQPVDDAHCCMTRLGEH